MTQSSQEWMPREQWEALVRGEDCPLCQEVQSDEPANAYGYTIADLRLSRLRLAMNQFVTGYSVLICNRHVREPYHLTREEQQLFFADMMQAAQALETVFKPIKMNFQLLGNAVPHLHAHLIPRYYGDPAPGWPINPDAQRVVLTPEAYRERVQTIRAILKGEGE